MEFGIATWWSRRFKLVKKKNENRRKEWQQVMNKERYLIVIRRYWMSWWGGRMTKWGCFNNQADEWTKDNYNSTKESEGMMKWGSSCGGCRCCAKSLQSCPTLCDPTDGSPPGSSVPGILQARTLEWVAISFSHMEVIWRLFQQLKVYSQSKMLKLMEVIQFWGINIEHSCETDCLNHSRKVCGRCRGQNEALLLSHFSCVWLCATPQTAAHHAPPPLGFSRQH